MTAAAARNVTMKGGAVARLMNAGIEAQVAHQFLRTAEAMDVTYRGQHAARYYGVDSTDGHQSLHLRVDKCALREVFVDHGELARETKDFVMVAKRHTHLIWRKRQLLKQQPPAFAVDPIALSGNKVGVEDRLDPVLQARQLRDQLRPLGNAAPFQLDRLRRYPDLGQELRRVQASQCGRIDLVGFNLRPGDRAHLQRIGDRDPAHKRCEQAHDDSRIAGRLDHDVVVFGQAAGKLEDCFAVHRDATMVLDHAVLKDCNLGKRPVNIQADDSHRSPPQMSQTRRKLADNTTITDSRSRRNRASRRGSQITTRARGSLSNRGLPANCASVAPIPVEQPYAKRPQRSRRERAAVKSMPGNNWLENRIRPVALGRSNWLFAGSLRAGQRAAVIMSLIQSAKLNGHDPYRYLKDVLERLPTQPASRLEELLPHRWQPSARITNCDEKRT